MSAMLVKLSTKGQLVVPREIRQALGLRPGSQLQAQIEGRKIVLEPLDAAPPADTLYGRYAGTDFLTEMEVEHRQELSHE